MKNLMLVVNPYSGTGRAKTTLFPVLDAFCSHGYSPTVYMTGIGETSCDTLVKKYGAGYDLIVCIGGDGTLSGVVNGLMTIPDYMRPSVGYIPLGTANDVATTLALSSDPELAVSAIVKQRKIPYDIGLMGSKYFTYIAAFGAFTEVSYQTPQNLKKALGHAAYVFSGLGALPSIKPKHTIVEYDDGIIEGDFIFGAVCNSRSVAGLVKLKPELVNLSDGMFEVILVRKPLDAEGFLKMLDDATTQKFQSKDLILVHTKSVKFTFGTDVAWTRDGEDGGKHRMVEITNINKAVNLIF